MKSARAGIVHRMQKALEGFSTISIIACLALSGCQAWVTPIPISPFESQASRSRGQTHSEQPVTEPSSEQAPKTKNNPQSARVLAPKVSMFLVRWSLPASATDINQFRLDYGVNHKSLDSSIRLHRRDLESDFTPDNTAVIFKHPISMPGVVTELSVKVSAISDTGVETPSVVFTSKRIGESPTL